MKPINPFRSRSLAFSLLALSISANSLIKANIIGNGDFSSNASSFTSIPGYLANGANPQIQSWNFIDSSNGAVVAGINGPDTYVGELFAPTSTVGISNFAFIQNGIALIAQNLPALLPDQEYSITVAAAKVRASAFFCFWSTP